MGLANQAVTPGRTTLLEAVNVCLAVIGEAPISTLETQQVGEAAQAERTLLEYHKEGQTRGWGWNRERAVLFFPDATSREVLIPPSVVKWAPSRLDWNNRFQARGSRVYDTEERSYAIPESIASIEADIVSLLPWDDCPEVFNRWATIRAARVFSNRAVGNTTTYQLTQSDEDQAWADLLRVDTEQSQPNAVTGEEAWATFRPAMGLGRRHGGSGGWGTYGSGSLVDLGGSSAGGSVTFPQALGPDASPTFAGLTLSAFSTFPGQLCVLGTNGAVNPLPLGSGLSIVGGALVAAGGGGGGGGTTTITVGSTTTGLAGTNASVVNVGTSTAAVLNFTIPAGAAGPSGVANATAPITYNSGTQTVGISAATTSAAGSMSSADKTKLDGIASGATANSSDATLLARANHTGTQAASTITGLATVATTGAYADLTGKPTLAAVATSGSASDLGTGTLPAARIPATAVTAGSYGSASLVPVITVGADGRITAASTTAVSSSGGTVTSVTGTNPIISSGGVTPAISISAATTSAAGSMSATDKSKLDGIASGATANSSDATLLARANHTGTQAASTITGLGSLATQSATLPSGAIVGTTDTQTLSGKTLGNLKETTYTITDGAAFEIDPANGSVQTITLGANRTPAATNFSSGQSVKLKIDDGTAYAITWTTVGVVWIGQTAGASGTAPTLGTTGWTHIELWKEGSIIYGALIGYSAT